MSVPVVTALAMRYADELSQNYYDVMSVMERMYSERVRVAMSGSRSDLLQQQHNNATSGSINVINQVSGQRTPDLITLRCHHMTHIKLL